MAAPPAITSPTPNQVFTEPPVITGTGTVDDFNQVQVNIQGTGGTESGTGGLVDVQPDGTWSFDGARGRLDPGTYRVTACQNDECADPVPFKIGRVSPITSIAAVSGSFSDLARRKLKISVTCASTCDIQGTLRVSADAARRMTTGPVIGTFSKAEVPKGTTMLTVDPRGIEPLSVWPMFTDPVAVTVVVEDTTEQGTGSLSWFSVPSDRNGRGHEFIKGIGGPRQVSLGAASAVFQVKLKPIPWARYIAGGIDTPGKYFASSAKWSKDGHSATGADFKAGGTFTLTVPIAHPLRGLAKAKSLAPAVAELSVGILNKHKPFDHDEAHYFLELVK